jgi:hypothetical protein
VNFSLCGLRTWATKDPGEPTLALFIRNPSSGPFAFDQRETGKVAADIFILVPGDGRQGISHSGVSRSAIGSRLQAPAADGREADT